MFPFAFYKWELFYYVSMVSLGTWNSKCTFFLFLHKDQKAILFLKTSKLYEKIDNVLPESFSSWMCLCAFLGSKSLRMSPNAHWHTGSQQCRQIYQVFRVNSFFYNYLKLCICPHDSMQWLVYNDCHFFCKIYSFKSQKIFHLLILVDIII